MSPVSIIRWLVFFLATMTPVACNAVSGAEPTPTPTPVEVNRLYNYLVGLKEDNVAALRELEDSRQVRIRGRVDWIQEKKIRFYVEPPRYLAYDKYVECNFRSNAGMASLRKGDNVTVLGRLVRALRGRILGIGEHGAVIFEDCLLVEIHGSRSAN